MATVDFENVPSIPLNFQQMQFCREYLVDLSVKNAAIRAGYSPHTAGQIGSRLLRDARIFYQIEKLRKELSIETGITPERVLNELALIAFSNIKDIVSTNPETGDTTVDIKNLPRDKAAALSELSIDTTKGKNDTVRKVRAKNADKLTALVQLGKHLGIFNEKVEVTGTLSLEQLITKSMGSDAS